MDADLVEAYAATVIEIALPDGSWLLVEPRPAGEVMGEFPAGLRRVAIITAANPFSRPLSDAENADRNHRLEADLRELGAHVTAAVGRSPDGSWAEPSFAVLDADDAVVLELARAYEQHAVFLWTRDARRIVASDGSEIAVQGWRASPIRGHRA